jgi:hypothetical protein
LGKAKFKTEKTFDDTKGGAGNKAPRVDELTDLLKLPPSEWITLRFVGPTVSYGIHWIKTKKQDGKETSFPAVCLSYDPETEETDSTRECPWCDAESELIRFGPEYYSNAIVRSLQEDEPSKKQKHTEEEKESGFKKKGSKSWTPIRAVRLTRTLVRELKKLGALNRVKDKKSGETKAYPLSHPKYGCDINIMYDPNEKTPAKKYMVQKGERTALSDEEQEYLMQPIEDLQKPDSLKESNKSFERWAEKMDVGSKKKSKKKDDEDDEDSDEDDEDEAPKGKGKKGPAAKKGKSKKDDDEDDEDTDSDDDDEDDDEDDKPAKKKAGKKASKSDDDEDDEDEDSDDEDDDEDEPKSKKKPAGKKSKKDDDDEDEDEDEDEDDDEDEKPSKKSKAKAKSKKDDEDDLDDDDEDEDEKPKKGAKAKKKSKDEDDDLDDDDEDDEPKSKKKPAKKSKKDDDEDEDDDLDDDDEDEDDEPKAKKGKDKKKSKPAAKGKKSKKDDDDEDDLDEDEDD